MKTNNDKKTDLNFIIEDMENGDIRVSNSHEVMSQLMAYGLDYIELLLDGKTQLNIKTMPFKVYWIDDLPLKETLFSGIFKEGNA